MPIRTCQLCGKDFDTSAMGAGKKYCSLTCKRTRGGKVTLAEAQRWEKLGSAYRRLFPPQTVDDRYRAVQEFKKMGFTVTPDVLPIPCVVTVQRGYYPIALALGSNGGSWRDGDVVAYWSGAHYNYLKICSPCRNGRRSEGSPADFIKHPFRRGDNKVSCGMCRKCLATKHLKSIYDSYWTKKIGCAKDRDVVSALTEQRDGANEQI